MTKQARILFGIRGRNSKRREATRREGIKWGKGERSDCMAEDDRMAQFAQIPTSFGLRCRLVKTYDHAISLFTSILQLGFFRSQTRSRWPCKVRGFRSSGNRDVRIAPFLEMDKEHDNVVNCTTPNFTGKVYPWILYSCSLRGTSGRISVCSTFLPGVPKWRCASLLVSCIVKCSSWQ